jgi:hypothetical protein
VTALGFRIKSGYAIAVVLAGRAKNPTVVARRVVELSDPDVAETRQPYHDGFYKEENDPRKIARRVQIVKRCAKESMKTLVDDTCATRRQPSESARAALVVGSVIDPEQVGNPHIRAHAHEGKLFRTVVEDALRSHGIECDVIVEKQLAAKAAAGLRQPDTEIKRALAAFGKTLGGPWRAEEKAAATAAWLVMR